jgi:hypothetical protein
MSVPGHDSSDSALPRKHIGVMAVSSCHLERSAAKMLALRKRWARSREIPKVFAPKCRSQAIRRCCSHRTLATGAIAEKPPHGMVCASTVGIFRLRRRCRSGSAQDDKLLAASPQHNDSLFLRCPCGTGTLAGVHSGDRTQPSPARSSRTPTPSFSSTNQKRNTTRPRQQKPLHRRIQNHHRENNGQGLRERMCGFGFSAPFSLALSMERA